MKKLINEFSKKNMAFTLAEILITLGIIGVVAAVTIPVLINVSQDIEYKSAYKKAYSVASQAVNSARSQGLFEFVSGNNDPNIPNNWLAFMNQFKVAKKCVSSNCFDCWEQNGEFYASFKAPFYTSYSFIDSSGMSWAGRAESAGGGETYFFVDTNGFKKPNQFGKDRFVFFMIAADKTIVQYNYGIPAKIVPYEDDTNGDSSVCWAENKCHTTNDYYGTSWLYN